MRFTRHDLPIRRLASGALLTIPVFRYQGGPGKAVYIQANIHGPEIAGIGAIYELMRFLDSQESLNGTVTLVPSANPVGLDSKVNGLQTGYADLNEHVVGNFNRSYQLLVDAAPAAAPPPSPRLSLPDFVARHADSALENIVQTFQRELLTALEAVQAGYAATGMRHGLKLALSLQAMAMAADLVLDLHTAGNAIQHLYSFEKCFASGRYFGIPYCIALAEEDFAGVLDEACLLPWLRLQAAFKAQGRDIAFARFGKEAFTLELGNADSLHPDAMDIDARRIVNYLRQHGVLAGEAQLPPTPFYATSHANYQRYYAPSGGLLLWHAAPGDEIRAGSPLASILQTYALGQGEPLMTLQAAHTGILIDQMQSQVVHEGMEICAIASNMTRLHFP